MESGKQESRSLAGSFPASLLSRLICSKELMAFRRIAGLRSAGAASGPTPIHLLAPCQVRHGETEHNSANGPPLPITPGRLGRLPRAAGDAFITP
jgi:hypothetical protein